MVLDVFSRKIVGHEVHEAESADMAALLMRKASLSEGLAGRSVVLHSDNGSSFKCAALGRKVHQAASAISWLRQYHPTILHINFGCQIKNSLHKRL